MALYGLTPTGFVRKTLENLVADTTARITGLVGVVPVGALMKLMMAFLERVSEVWEILEAIVSGQDPDSATGTLQDAIAAITGTIRNGAAPSSVTLTLTGTPVTTTILTGSRAKIPSTGVLFATLEDKTIVAVSAWVASTNYVIGDRRRNGATQRVYVCTAAGMSAGSGGPSTTASAIADGGVTWRYIGDGTGAVDVTAECTVDGPTVAISGTINGIDTPVSGWLGVMNLQDAVVGSLVETNEELRVRREEELAQAGNGTPDAIRADMLEVLGVTSCTVFYNDSDIVDADGMTPHTVEVLVRGGTADAIGAVLLRHVAAGIKTLGTSSVVVTDSEGFPRTLKYSRPVEKNIGVIVNAITNDTGASGAPKFPTDGAAQMKAAIVAFGQLQKSGKNAVAFTIGAQAAKVDGALDITSVLIVGVAAPSTPGVPVASTTITIAPRELAVFDTSWITINTTPGVP